MRATNILKLFVIKNTMQTEQLSATNIIQKELKNLASSSLGVIFLKDDVANLSEKVEVVLNQGPVVKIKR